jgi:hypothetical protein
MGNFAGSTQAKAVHSLFWNLQFGLANSLLDLLYVVFVLEIVTL